jgi:ribonuclease D
MLRIPEEASKCLETLFMDPEKLKIFHGGTTDIQWLKFGHSVYCVNVFDTAIAYKRLKESNTGSPGLAFLLK